MAEKKEKKKIVPCSKCPNLTPLKVCTKLNVTIGNPDKFDCEKASKYYKVPLEQLLE